MELGCLLEYKGRAYYEASLAEPMSCSIGAFNAAYHTKMGVYHHEMGIKKGGKLAIMAGAGPMGLGCLLYTSHAINAPMFGMTMPLKNLPKREIAFFIAFQLLICVAA